VPVLVVFALGLPFFSFVNLVLRAFYAQKDMATPVQAAGISFLVNLGLSLALMRPLGTVGLAVASNVAVVVQAVYLQWRLARKHAGFDFHHLVGDLAKVMASSATMGGLVWLGWRWWSGAVAATKITDAAGLTIFVGAGVAMYGALLWALKIEGREDLAAVIAKVRSKFA
jgi:putative peptidoglycan lipid II flippase